MQTYVVMPLAADVAPDWGDVGENFKHRARKALQTAWNLNQTDKNEVWLAQGAGHNQTSEQHVNYAVLGTRYLERCRADLPIIVNYDDEKVWSTLAEVLWIYTEVKKRFEDPILVFVTQPRHLKRVQVIARWFLPKTARVVFVPSSQAFEVPWVHEFRAYGALALTWCGLGKLVRWIRRHVRLKVDGAKR